jgi:hypothetical protein
LNFLQASRYATIGWDPLKKVYDWKLKESTKTCQFTGTIESKMFFKFAVSRDFCKDDTKEILGGSKPDITTYFMGYCGLATAAPYNYSLLVTSYPDKGYIKSTEAALDPDARGWAVELEDTFIDCFELANAATKGSTPKKQVDTLAVMADCRDRCMHWRGGFATKGTMELPGAFPFLYFPLRGEVRHFEQQVMEVAKTSYGALEPTMIMLLTANYDCLTFSGLDACSTNTGGSSALLYQKFSVLIQYEPVMFYYLAQASSMMHDQITAAVVTGYSEVALLNTLQGCVEDEGAWQCPTVYCGDAAVEYGLSSYTKVESDFYITGNITVGASAGVPVNCSTVFRKCHMDGVACEGAEALGQKNRPLSLALQYDEVSIQWDWAAPSGAAALALIKPECPHVVNSDLSDCTKFDGLYYSMSWKTNESYHYYTPLAYMPTAWVGEIWKIVTSTTLPCGVTLSSGGSVYAQKMHMAKLYADKLDTLASERYSMIETVSLDSVFSDPMTMLKEILAGSFQYCYQGYSCGFSLYDASYLAGVIASMMFLKSYDGPEKGLLNQLYERNEAAGDYHADIVPFGMEGDAMFFDYRMTHSYYHMPIFSPSDYYYQYASTNSYPLFKPRKNKPVVTLFKKLFKCYIGAQFQSEKAMMFHIGSGKLDSAKLDVTLKPYAYDSCPPTLVCMDECSNKFFLSDGSCDDGGPGSEFMSGTGKYGFCEPGTDCEDCGDRWLVWNPDIHYVDFCDNVKACAQTFALMGSPSGRRLSSSTPMNGRRLSSSTPMNGRRLSSSTLSAGRMTVIYDDYHVGNGPGVQPTSYTDCFDLYSLELNGTTPKKFLKKWVKNRANLSLVVGLYDTCSLCQDFLKKLPDTDYKEVMNAATSMIKVLYYVYKPTTVLPLMPHCDNDFESMALKHTVAFDKSEVVSGEECLFMPSYLDSATEDWDETTKAAKSFLNTLYRFVEVLQGKELF